MKRLLALLILLLIPIYLFSKGEVVHETEHFKIIYSENTKALAHDLIEIAEEEYDRLVKLFGEDPSLHLPIYFNEEEKQFNAYLSLYPQSHIVFYTAWISTDLYDGKDTLRNIFRHELTHAFMNYYKGFLGKITTLFGDYYDIAKYLHYLNFITEGSAVYTESMDGKGRLNDPIVNSFKVQTRIEDKKINYLDAAGSRDIHPVGSLQYLLGGAFFEWISERYGEEKVTAFILDIAKNVILFPQNAYSKHFSSRLYDDWNTFLKEIKTPDEIKKPTIISNKSNNYSDLFAYNDEVYTLSSYEGKILSVDKNEAKKLFSFANCYESTISKNEKYFLISQTSSNLCFTALYTLKGKELQRFNSYHEGILINDDIALIKYNDGYTYLDIYNKESFNLGYSVNAKNLFIYNDNIGFLFEDERGQAIAILNKEITLYRIPSEIKIDSVSANNNIISISYNNLTEGELVKYGEIDINNKKIYLSDVNINGGIYYPVRVKDDIFYISQFYSSSAISTTNVNKLNLKEEYVLIEEKFEEKEEKEIIIDSKKYNPILSIQRGTILPFFGSFTDSSNTKGFGLSWTTSDPTEKFKITSFTGWNIKSNSLFLKLKLSYKDLEATLNIDDKYYYSSLYYFKKFYLKDETNYISISNTISYSSSSYWSNLLSFNYSDIHRKGKNRNNYLGYRLGVTFQDIKAPTLNSTIYLSGLFPTSFNFKYYLSSNTLVVNTNTHIFTLEVQKALYPLPLYITNIDFSGGITSYIKGNKIDNIYNISLILTLAPTIGKHSQIHSDFGFKASYDKNWKFTFVFNNYY